MKQDIDTNKLLDELRKLFDNWKNKDKHNESFDLGFLLGIKASQILIYCEEKDEDTKKQLALFFGFREDTITKEIEKIKNEEISNK